MTVMTMKLCSSYEMSKDEVGRRSFLNPKKRKAEARVTTASSTAQRRTSSGLLLLDNTLVSLNNPLISIISTHLLEKPLTSAEKDLCEVEHLRQPPRDRTTLVLGLHPSESLALTRRHGVTTRER